VTIRSGVGELSLELDFSMQACYPRPSETGSLATAQRLRVRSGCAGSPSQITQVQQRAIGLVDVHPDRSTRGDARYPRHQKSLSSC
jgi:hypothetical protein